MATGISLGTSGLDIDSLVTSAMSTYQAKYDKVDQKEQTAEWTKSAYADIYSAVKDFQTTISDYKMSSNTETKAVTSSSTAVTAIANADAVNMAHDVSVSSVASSVSLQSTAAIGAVDSTTNQSSIKLSDVIGITSLPSGAATTDTAISFTVNDGTTSATISYTYEQLLGSDSQDAVTLNDLASSLKKSGTNLTASYDSVNDSFSIYNKSTGSANKIQITAEAGTDSGAYSTAGANANTLFSALNLGSYGYADGATEKTLNALTDVTDLATGIAGTDAVFTVDGKEYTKSSNTNQIGGVTYTVNAVTDSAASVNVSTDTDTIVEKVQSFVDAYNKVLETINDKVHATKYSDYTALTDAEKEEMSDDDITAWEDKAKSGLLRKDSILSGIVSKMRSSLSTAVSGVSGDYTTLSSIGITASSTWSDYGTISLDEDTLKEAIADDPECVYNLFSTKGDSDDSDTQGIAYRLYDIAGDGMDSISDKAGTSAATDDQSTLGVKITTLQDQLDALQDILDDKETYFYNKYNAMETAMSKASSSLTTLTSYLS